MSSNDHFSVLSVMPILMIRIAEGLILSKRKYICLFEEGHPQPSKLSNQLMIDIMVEPLQWRKSVNWKKPPQVKVTNLSVKRQQKIFGMHILKIRWRKLQLLKPVIERHQPQMAPSWTIIFESWSKVFCVFLIWWGECVLKNNIDAFLELFVFNKLD